MEFSTGDAFRREEPPTGHQHASSPDATKHSGAAHSQEDVAAHARADSADGEPVSAWSGASPDQVDAAVQESYRQAAKAALDEKVHPVNLSAYHDQASTDAGVLGGPGTPGGRPLPPGAGPAALERLRDLAPTVTQVAAGSCQLGGDDLDQSARLLLSLGEQVETAQVFLLADAMHRGQVTQSDSGSPRQWLTDRAPRLEPGQASRIATAATIINEPRNACLRAALAAGHVTVRAVVVAAREVEHAQAALPNAPREELFGYYLAVGHDSSTKDLRHLTAWIIEVYGGTQPTKNEEKLSKVESLTWSELATGMTRIKGQLSPADAAIFKFAIQALAAPQTGTDPDTGERVPDLRAADKRRADALMELIQAGIRAGDSDLPGTTATKCAVTIPLSVLIGAVASTRCATTSLGDLLDAGTARELACDAHLIPVVLGTASEPLDIGRAARPFNTATRTAIAARDADGCTFPGCNRPVPWCQIHHAIPWWVGGASELSNGVLLCSRHHHIVHNKRYLPWIGKDRVTWDLIPDQMPNTPPGTRRPAHPRTRRTTRIRPKTRVMNRRSCRDPLTPRGFTSTRARPSPGSVRRDTASRCALDLLSHPYGPTRRRPLALRARPAQPPVRADSATPPRAARSTGSTSDRVCSTSGRARLPTSHIAVRSTMPNGLAPSRSRAS